MDDLFYDCEKKVCVPSKWEWYKAPIEETPFYKALDCHRSQNAITFAKSMINSDQVFWERRSDNLLLHGKVEATSGQTSYINDFMLFDADEIHEVKKIKMCADKLQLSFRYNEEKSLELVKSECLNEKNRVSSQLVETCWKFFTHGCTDPKSIYISIANTIYIMVAGRFGGAMAKRCILYQRFRGRYSYLANK